MRSGLENHGLKPRSAVLSLPQDHVLARSGTALQKLIERRADGSDGARVEAQVQTSPRAVQSCKFGAGGDALHVAGVFSVVRAHQECASTTCQRFYYVFTKTAAYGFSNR